MIFVTVGTHEQPFDRLVKYVDELKGSGAIGEEVVMQTGFCTYEPQHCEWSKLIPYQQMVDTVRRARIVITHGGPASFIMPLQMGKIPVVVPRRKEFDEHVNNHQVDFCHAVAERQGTILVVDEIEKLGEVLAGYDEITAKMTNAQGSNNAKFNEEFGKIVDELFAKKA